DVDVDRTIRHGLSPLHPLCPSQCSTPRPSGPVPPDPRKPRCGIVSGMGINVVDHPLVGDRLRMLRDAATDTAGFRAAMAALGTMVGYGASREAPSVWCP